MIDMPAAKNVTVIGDGGWGTALALVLLRNGHNVTIWGPFEEYINEMVDSRHNSKFLNGVALPDNLKLTSCRAEAVAGAEAFVLATPTKFFAAVMESFADLIPAQAHLVSVAKGFNPDDQTRMTQTAERILAHPCVAALSGPSHAEEVARGELPAAVTLAATDADESAYMQDLFTNPLFRVYTSTDVIGVELGGAMKNVMAVAAGICDGLGYGDNTKAALVTRGLAEMTRLGVALGAQPSTFSGLSGIGDLIVTCCSSLSRNHAVGERLGKGESLEQIRASMEQVAEGVWTCKTALRIAQEQGIDAPITSETHAVIYENKDPSEAVRALLMRDPKPEGA